MLLFRALLLSASASLCPPTSEFLHTSWCSVPQNDKSTFPPTPQEYPAP